MKAKSLVILASTAFLWSCSMQKQIGKSAQITVLNDAALQTAHVGISIFEPATNKYWFNYQGDKYFVPASNTKLATCYAAMKYLGDSLTGFSYAENADTIFFKPNGDPTFLHSDFKAQSFFNYLSKSNKRIVQFLGFNDRFQPLGSGWAWNDYQEYYMPERSRFPIYGNVVSFERNNNSLKVTPKLFLTNKYFHEPMMQLLGRGENFSISRKKEENLFQIENAFSRFTGAEVPFKTDPVNELQRDLLSDTLHKNVGFIADNKATWLKPFKTQATDSVFKLMMHRSDNFFAEQSLLMVSNEVLGVMNDAKIIDTILKTDFKDLPQKPRWADGSGLSRYNLFTPQDFVSILHKMKNEFGMERIKAILATGNTGTLSHYYVKDSSFIFAKTGTLSGVVALSGFLYTQKNKLLLFSVLVNNHTTSATTVRRAVEKFIEGIRERY